MSLRSRVIRLAHEHPEFRPHLLPVLKESAGQKKVPLSQRPPQQQVRYHIDTALRWLKVGAPSGANDSLRQALRLLEVPSTFGAQTAVLTRLITQAIQTIGGAFPRAGDELVERILKMMPPKEVQKKTLMSDLPLADQVRFNVGTARNWIKAGNPSGAKSYVAKGLALAQHSDVIGPRTSTLVRLLENASQELAANVDPRIAGELLEKALKMLPART